ncbi:DNA (cytosine-5-)-methyltransferase [Naumannella sp. ID2617S]|nr:DNA (cytosine-5-)-methyltransferase [Naumannella sp. ID2617S]
MSDVIPWKPILPPTDYLEAALARYSTGDVAKRLDVHERTLLRWKKDPQRMPRIAAAALRELVSEPSLPASQDRFKFIDLFAGIGGIRLGFQEAGGDCVFSSEWDPHAKKTYLTNYPDDVQPGHEFVGDITKVPAESIPDHDVLLAGFPCQPFSIAGVSKKNALGRKHGFEDVTQGTLFFDVARIIDEKRPGAFLLENVKNLQSHDKGRTFEVIRRTLTEELGYELHVRVVDGAHFVPQHRERILMVGFKEPTDFDWCDLQLPPKGPKVDSILHKVDGTEPVIASDAGRFFDHERQQVQEKYTLTPRLWEYLQAYSLKHKAAGNGFGFGLAGPGTITRTLSARYYKDGSEILIPQAEGRPRRLTPRECARLMGFPDSFSIPVSDTQAYRQFGNSVVAPVMSAVAQLMLPHIVQSINGLPATQPRLPHAL